MLKIWNPALFETNMVKSFVGDNLYTWELALLIILAILSSFCFAWQVLYLQHLKILPTYVLPVVSFCICFENCVLTRGSNIDPDSVTASFTYVLHSLQTPLLITALYESAFRLHETRAVHFFCFPFDQGFEYQRILALGSVWLVRLIAAGLFVINLVVDFHLVRENDDDKQGPGGHIYLSENKHDTDLWLALIPPIALSFFALLVSNVMNRYVFKFSYRDNDT